MFEKFTQGAIKVISKTSCSASNDVVCPAVNPDDFYSYSTWMEKKGKIR